MRRDLYFDMPLHDNDELAEIVGERIVCREKVHHWPGSRVEVVVGASGQIHFYKSRRGGDIESRFYETVRNPIAVRGRTVHRDRDHVCLLLDFVAADRKQPDIHGDEAKLSLVNTAVDAVASLTGALPAWDDWRPGGSRKWLDHVREMAGRISTTIDAYAYMETKKDALGAIVKLAEREDVARIFDEPCVYGHGDLGPDNIIRTAHGLRVIDWDRPEWRPREIEVAHTLRCWDVDPLEHVDPQVVFADLFLAVCYLNEAQGLYAKHCWYDHEMAQLLERMEDAALRFAK